MKRTLIIGLVAIFYATLFAHAEANKAKVADFHLISLLHGHCDLGFNDDRAKIFADTYASEEGGVSAEEIATAKLDEQRRYHNFLKKGSKDERCALSAHLLTAFPEKWRTWVQ